MIVTDRDRQTDRQTGRQAGRQAGRQRQNDRDREKNADEVSLIFTHYKAAQSLKLFPVDNFYHCKLITRNLITSTKELCF